MANLVNLTLTDRERQELEVIRDHHPKPYMRERAAALLKIGEGQSAHYVALHGLYKKRDPDTIYEWLHRYQSEGIKGLAMRSGRGRKAAFSP